MVVVVSVAVLVSVFVVPLLMLLTSSGWGRLNLHVPCIEPSPVNVATLRTAHRQEPATSGYDSKE